MKKTVFLCIFCILCVKIFAQTGVIREMAGEVTLKSAGSDTFVPAVVGGQVSQDTIVSTGFRSTAVIVIGSSVLSVRPLTRLSLAEIQAAANSETLNINLQTGRVRVDVKPPAGARASVSVQSPSATASVRGTEIEMDTLNLHVISGTVDFKGQDGLPVIVTTGDSGSVSGNSLGQGGSAADLSGAQTGDIMPSPPVGTQDSGAAFGSSAPVTTAEAEFVVDFQ